MCVKSIPLTCLGLLLGLMLAGPASAQDAVQDPDLLGWWKLDESSGNLALDSSGNGNDGMLKNGASWVSGPVGGAVSLDGVDAYIEIPHGTGDRKAAFQLVDNGVSLEDRRGAGLYSRGSRLVIRNCTFVNNSTGAVVGTGKQGGGGGYAMPTQNPRF